MGGATPKAVKAPPVPPPAAIPEVEEDEVKKTLRRRRGRKETFLTGELIPEETGLKKVLG